MAAVLMTLFSRVSPKVQHFYNNLYSKWKLSVDMQQLYIKQKFSENQPKGNKAITDINYYRKEHLVASV